MCAMNIIKNVRFPDEEDYFGPAIEPNPDWTFSDLFKGGNEGKTLWSVGMKIRTVSRVQNLVDDSKKFVREQSKEYFLDLKVRFHQMEIGGELNSQIDCYLLDKNFVEQPIHKNVNLSCVDSEALEFTFTKENLLKNFRHNNYNYSIIVNFRLYAEQLVPTGSK